MKFYFLRHQSDHTLNPLTYQCFRVHRHNTEAYRDLHCLFSLDYKRNSFLYSASSPP